tara:strand:- start:42 stop:1997 length:1956 start_codon:yes stop_codon:yes gene_type:complete
MANYRKSFNFRNGVQVDNDNFIVNANGLVGIGTSIPTEFLDVRGTTKVTGIVTSTDLWVNEDAYIGGATTTTILKVGTAVTITGGIVTATKFSGDGSQLTGLSQAAWTINSSGLSTSADVGVGTDNPLFKLQLGEYPLTGNGVGIDSIGNIYVSAGGTFGSAVDINGSLDVDGQTDLDELVVAGVSTFSAAIDVNVGANIAGGLTLDHLNVTGVSTFADDAVINAGGLDVTGVGTFTQLDINGQTDLSGVVVAGVSTFSAAVDINAVVDIDGQLDVDELIVAGVSTFSSAVDINAGLDVDGQTDLDELIVAGVSTFSSSIDANASANIAGGTTLDQLNVTGVSTFNNGSVKIAVTSGGTSGLSTFYGLVKYGNETGSFGYSTRRSVDLLNYDSGNVNFYLDAGSIGLNTGDFHWHKATGGPLMTLAYDGKLGIGITLPQQALHVSGASTITGNSFFGSNLNVKSNLTVNGNVIVDGSTTFNGSITGDLLTGNVYSTSGVSTFAKLRVTGSNSNFNGVGIGTTNSDGYPLSILGGSGAVDTKFFVTTDGNIGIKTTIIDDTIGINAIQTKATFGAIGVGTTSPQSVVDFRDAGQDATGASANKMYMYPPKVTTTQRNNLTGMTGGAFVYNTTENRLEFYQQGVGWRGVSHTS